MTEREIVIYNDEECYKYPDGTIRSKHGEMRYLPTELARSMGHGRAALAQEHARQGIQRAAKSDTPEAGWSKIIEKRTEVALHGTNVRAANEAARLVGQAAGYLTADRSVEEHSVVRHEYNVDPETRKLLQEMIRERRENHITIEATLEDVDE